MMIFKVENEYRRITVNLRDSRTLLDLHNAIFKALRLEPGHQHAFFMDNMPWSNEKAYYSDNSDDPELSRTDAITLDKLGLKNGDKFIYIYDFSEEQVFTCTYGVDIEFV